MSEDRTTTSPWIWLPIDLLLAVVLMYLPLLASWLENRCLGTDYIYALFDRAHLADLLEKVYHPVVDLFQ